MIERATVTVLTTRMVEQGWVARKPGENRRTFRLVMTEAGAELLQRLIPRAVELACQTLAGISEDQLREMEAALALVEARLRAPTPEEE